MNLSTYLSIYLSIYPANISASNQGCSNAVDQRSNNVDGALKMKKNQTLDFQYCTKLIQPQ